MHGGGWFPGWHSLTVHPVCEAASHAAPRSIRLWIGWLAGSQVHALLLQAAGWSEDRLKNEHWAAQVLVMGL